MSSTRTALVGAAAQSTEVKIELTGQLTKVPGNLISKALYKYNCISKTSLGPLILDATISMWSVVAWTVAILFFTLHLSTLLCAFIFFVVPLDRAKNLALLVPTKSTENISGMINEFIKITAAQTSAYALTNFQAAIFAQASMAVEIEMM
eukprot:gene65657-89825_t